MANDHQDRPTHAVEQPIVSDDLTMENLVAAAIWEQIELHRLKNESPEGDPPKPAIDPSFQSDYDNI